MWLPGYVTSKGRARLIVEAYLLAAVSSALLGMLALAGVIPGAAVLTEGGRARALFQDPNVFGPFLVPAAVIVAEELVRPRLLRASRAAKALMLVVLVLGATTFHGTPALRISVSGWNTSDEDADRSVAAIVAAVDAVRQERAG